MIAHTYKTWFPLAAACVVACGIATFNSPAAAVAAALIAFVGLLYVPQALLPLLILASALNRFGLQSGDSQLRLDLLTVILAALVVGDRIAVRTLAPRRFASPLLAPLVAYAACNIFSTLAFASERTRGLKLDAQIVAVVLAVAVLTAYLRERGGIERCVRYLWFVTVTEAVVGLGLLAANLAGLAGTGIQYGSFGLPMAYGTSYEANIFASFLVGNFFVLLADYAVNGRGARYGAGLILVVIAIAASETRTAWLGLLIGLSIFSALYLRRRTGGGNLLPIVAAIPGLALVAGILGATTPLASRLLDVINLHSSSAAGRLVIFQAAIADWKTHPIFGLGTGSFNFGRGPGQPHPWLPNLLLLTLHDTGVVGLGILIWMVYRVFKRTFNAGLHPGPGSAVALGAIPGFTALLIAFQTTSGFWFLYPWIVACLGVTASMEAT